MLVLRRSFTGSFKVVESLIPYAFLGLLPLAWAVFENRGFLASIDSSIIVCTFLEFEVLRFSFALEFSKSGLLAL